MGVSFSLKKQLDQFNLDVSCSFPGGVLVIQGESGSGKSTILNCISGLLTPENGKVEVNSRVVYNSSQNVNIPVQKRNIGYVFQNYQHRFYLAFKHSFLPSLGLTHNLF